MKAPSRMATAGTWCTVLLLAGTGGWLLWAPQQPTSPSPASTTATKQVITSPGPTPEPRAQRRAPARSTSSDQPTAVRHELPDEATATGTVPDQPRQLNEPSSGVDAQSNDTDLLDQEWLPSDHSGAGTRPATPTESTAATTTAPVDEARRQLGQAFPDHLRPDAPGVDGAIRAAQTALEQDLRSTPLRRDLEQIAALVLTPDPVPEPGATLDDLAEVDVVVEVQIQTRMRTTETRLYRVTLARTADEGWVTRSIRLA